MANALVAIDVAIFLPEQVAALARTLNAALSAGEPHALRLDAGHLPHITLAQQFVERARLAELYAELDRILRHESALALRIRGAGVDHGTVSLAIDATPDLQRLHEQVMDAIEPFESPDGGRQAFNAGGEVIRPEDVDWVRNYREESATLHYRPHVTVGHGETAPPVPPVEFQAQRVAVCELGRFCTCRRVLHEWTI